MLYVICVILGELIDQPLYLGELGLEIKRLTDFLLYNI